VGPSKGANVLKRESFVEPSKGASVLKRESFVGPSKGASILKRERFVGRGFSRDIKRERRGALAPEAPPRSWRRIRGPIERYVSG
jgi:hypothetical protein